MYVVLLSKYGSTHECWVSPSGLSKISGDLIMFGSRLWRNSKTSQSWKCWWKTQPCSARCVSSLWIYTQNTRFDCFAVFRKPTGNFGMVGSRLWRNKKDIERNAWPSQKQARPPICVACSRSKQTYVLWSQSTCQPKYKNAWIYSHARFFHHSAQRLHPRCRMLSKRIHLCPMILAALFFWVIDFT